MFNWITSVLGIGGKIVDRVLPDKSASRDAQSRINEAEVAGGPSSVLRLWRSFLGWCLSVAFIWEVVGRPVIMTYWPDTKLPPSVLKEISSLLLSMLGLGF